MASQQLRRRDMEKKTADQNADQRPQVTHFESVTVMDSGAQPTLVHRVVDTMQQAQPQKQTADNCKASSLQATQEQTKKHQSGSGATHTTLDYKAPELRSAWVKDNAAGSPIAIEKTPTAKDYTLGISGQRKGLLDAREEDTRTAKDIAMETGRTTAEYAGKAAGVVKDAAVVAGYGATELASRTESGATESMETLNAGVSGMIEGTAELAAEKALGLTDTVRKGAGYIGEKAVAGKDVALDTGKTAVRKGVGAAKDATLAAGWSAAEFAGETKEGVRESMEGLNAGVGGIIEGTAVAAETAAEKAIGVAATAVDAGIKGAQYMVRGKDVALQTGKTAANVVKEASLRGGRRAAEFAGDATVGARESMEGLNAGVGGIIEGTALATEEVAQKTFDTVADAGKMGATYVGEKVVAGKDVTLETGKAAGEYARKAGGVVKDATLVAGWSAAEFASDTAAGVTESTGILNEGVAGVVERTAIATEDVAQKTFHTLVDVGKKGASYIGETAAAGKEITSEAGEATAEYLATGARAVKDAALVCGWGAVEVASDTTKGVTESMETVNAGVAGLVEGAAVATEAAAEKAKGLKDVAVDVGKKGASYMGEKSVAGKDVTLETGRTTAEFANKAADVAKDATLVAGWGAAELASGTAAGVNETMENLNAGVAGLVEGTAVATENVAQETLGTMVDAGKKGARYVGEKAVSGAQYVGKAMDASKGASEGGAAEFPRDTRYVGVGTQPKSVVVEKEEIRVDFDQRKNNQKKA